MQDIADAKKELKEDISVLRTDVESRLDEHQVSLD
jgi:hypothetical protein